MHLGTITRAMKILNVNCKRLHIELTNQCALKCLRCERTGKEMQIACLELSTIQKLLEDPSGPRPQNVTITLSGTLGDSIYHPDLHAILAYLKSQGFRIALETNGSHRSLEWWKKTAEILTQDDEITFSLDGVAEELYVYRVGADWESILLGINTIKNYSPCNLVWKFIVFSHNEQFIEAARKKSQDLGFHQFKIIKSSRFLKNDFLLPSLEFHPLRLKNKRELQNIQRLRYVFLRKIGEPFRLNFIRPSVEPECMSGEGFFLSYDGYLLPCPVVNKKPWFKENQEAFNLNTRSLTEVLKSPKWDELKMMWSSYDCSPLSCQKRCGKSKNFQGITFDDDEITQNFR